MEKWESNIVVNRPVEDVFAFVINPENGPLWHIGSGEIQPISEEPIGVGKRHRIIKQIFVWRLETVTEVTEYELNQKVSFKSISGPYPFELRYTFERVNSGTRLTEFGEAKLPGFLKLAVRLTIGTAKKNSEAGLSKLKRYLEA